jgi:hypothetical protein
MTPEEIREKLAAFMGWELENYETGEPAKTPEDYADASNNDGWSWSGFDGEAWQWKPDKNRNHLALVLERVAEKGLGSSVAIYVNDDDLIDSRPTYGCSCSVNWDAAFKLLTAPSETICQAILKVIEKEPTP